MATLVDFRLLHLESVGVDRPNTSGGAFFGIIHGI